MHTIIKTIKLLAIYARVSTSRQEDEQTILNQTNALEEFAKKNGYTIVRRYIDEGWSGDTLARPELDNLRQDAKSKQFDAVLIYDPDRLARRYSYQELVSDELREAGVEVMYITVSAPKNSEDKILHGVRGLFAEYERAKISERFRLGKLRKIKDGHLLVSEPLYGYSYIPRQDKVHGYYVINEEEARVVRMIFSWVADERMTLRTVVRKLQELNIKPRKSKRGVWNTSTLSTLFRNEAYIGSAHWGSSYAVVPLNPLKNEKYKKMKKSSRKIKPREEWSSVPVPAILGREVFDKARRQLEQNFALCKRNKKNEYLLSGRIVCSCGRRRTGEGVMNGKHLYYRCNDRVLNFPLPRVCMEKGINARTADEMVWKKVSQLMISPKLLTEQVERWYDNQKTKRRGEVLNIPALKEEIEKLKVQEERYGKAYSAGVYTIEQLKDYTADIREQMRKLEKQIGEAEQKASEQNVTRAPTKSEIKKFSEMIKSNIDNLSFEAKRDIMLATVEKIVGTSEHLFVSGYIPVNNLYEYKTSYRNRRPA
jgi:site-specific DNA recombinase